MKDALSKTKPSAGKRKPSAARLQRVRDLRLVVCLLLTAAVGLCVLLLGELAVLCGDHENPAPQAAEE